MTGINLLYGSNSTVSDSDKDNDDVNEELMTTTFPTSGDATITVLQTTLLSAEHIFSDNEIVEKSALIEFWWVFTERITNGYFLDGPS